MSFWPAFCHAYNKPILIDWLIEDVQLIMKFNILHSVLLLSSIRYPSSSDFLSFRGLSNSFPSSVSTACSVFFVYPFTQCYFTSHLQYEVHYMPADQQLLLALEHGGTDLHPQATSSDNSLGATTLPQIGTGMPSSIFHPNMERLAAGGSF